MSGISSKAAGKLENKRKFNAGTELNTDFDINLYETNFRSLDPQLGRFWQVDPMADAVSEQSPYVYANNNPISFNDPLGLLSDSLHPVVLSEVVVTSKVKTPNAFVPYINFPNGKSGTIASIKDWPLSFSRDRTNDLVDSWAIGLGSNNRIYLPYHPMTKRLQNAYQVNRARAYFYKKYLSKFNSGASLKGASVTNFNGSFGLFGLVAAGTDIVEQYVGSMNIDIQVDEKGENMLFILGNNTSKTSALYHAADSYERTPGNEAMGNMYQVYIWKEPITTAGFNNAVTENRMDDWNSAYRKY